MHAYILYSYFNLITLKKSPHHTVRPTFSQVIAEEYSENDCESFKLSIIRMITKYCEIRISTDLF